MRPQSLPCLTSAGSQPAAASTGSEASAQEARLLARGTDTPATPALALERSRLVVRRDAALQSEAGSVAARSTQLQAGGTLDLRSHAAVSLDAPSTALSQGDTLLTGAQLTNAGTVQSGGALTIAATSALNTGSLSSQARLTLDAAQLDNTGLVHAGAAAQLRVATLNNPGVIAATGAVSLTGQQLTNAGTLGAGLAPDAQGKLQPLASSDPRAAAAALTIRATDQLTQTATGQLLAGGQLQVAAGAALLEGRATAMTLAIAGERGLHLQQAELHATQDAALRSDGELTLDQSRLLAQRDVRVDAARATLTDSTVQAGGRADANIAGALTLQSTQAGLPTALRAAGDVTVNAERLTTRRSGDGRAALLAAGLLPDGRLAGSGDLTLSTAAALQSDAVVLSAGTARLTGRDLQLAQAQVQGQQVQLHALGGDLNTR